MYTYVTDMTIPRRREEEEKFTSEGISCIHVQACTHKHERTHARTRKRAPPLHTHTRKHAHTFPTNTKQMSYSFLLLSWHISVYIYIYIYIYIHVRTHTYIFYGSVHRWSILIIVQRDATQSSLIIILQVHSTCFACQPHPSSGVHKTVTTASGTGNILCTATSLQHGQLGHVGGRYAQKIWPVTEAAVTVLCTPDDGCFWHRKYVEWTCRIIIRLLCVASRLTIINAHTHIYTCVCVCMYEPIHT